MSVLRTFIAIELPKTVQERVRGQQKELKAAMADLPLRWVPVENIHLTLKFLGDVSESNVQTIADLLKSACSQYSPMEISVGEIGAFPDLRRPRVLWLGVQAPDDLHHLQARLEAEMERLGYTPERRDFTPHLTLARVQRGASRQQLAAIGEQVTAHSVGFLAAAVIEELALFKSELKADGAVYTRLSSAALLA